MAWKTRLFMELMLTVMLLVIAGPAMAGDINRQERREDRQERRWEQRENFCCDEEVFFDSGFDFVPFFYFIEEIGIDSVAIDADWNSLIDDGCEVEVEIKAAGWWD